MERSVYRTDIPADSQEILISPYREETHCTANACSGRAIWYERREYRLDGELRGERHFDRSGCLMIESPMRHGQVHRTYYRWHENGRLDILHPYLAGKLRGTCQQWSEDGPLMGTFTFIHGTGLQLWFHPWPAGRRPGFYLSEISPYQDGLQHGTEMWINEDQQTIRMDSSTLYRYFPIHI